MIRFSLIIIILFFFLLSGCKDNNPTDDGGISIPLPIPPTIYDSPIWHPSGKFIGFNHTPLKSIHYSVNDSTYPDHFEFEQDSSGFWLINSDGTNMRKILSYTLQDPVWSPDGNWIAFVVKSQIYKMKFTGIKFDTTTLEQLTTKGNNLFPAWSLDGNWIAYSESICDDNNACGLWLMKSDGLQHSFLADYGNFPTWNHTNNEILYETRAIASNGEAIGDSLWSIDIQTKTKSFFIFLGGINNNNQYFKYGANGKQIAFASQPKNKQVNLWMMDSIGTNIVQLTFEGINDDSGMPFSWDPSGKFVVFTKYRFDSWPPQNGTLWIIDINTFQQKQLTYSIH